MTSILLLLCLFQADVSPVDAVVAKLEKSELVINDKQIARVTRHDDGSVKLIDARNLQLNHDEWKAIASLPRLEGLRAHSSNIADEDVAAFADSKTLKWVNLSATEVTDEVVQSLGKMPALKSLCLGSVRVSPAAVQKLKSLQPELQLGYYQRGRAGFAGPAQDK
jgi:hypothetical protein